MEDLAQSDMNEDENDMKVEHIIPFREQLRKALSSK